MWYCEDCEEVFDEPTTYHDDLTEFWGVWGSGTYEGCPNPKCKSEFIREIEEEEEDCEDGY